MGQSGARLLALSWTVDMVTVQGVPGVVEVPRSTVEPPEFLAQARGGASRGLRRKSLRMPVQQASSTGSLEQQPSKRQRTSGFTEEEPTTVSDETEEPTDVDLNDTSGSTAPKTTHAQEVASSEPEEEASEEDEEEGEDGDED
ncbi:hypothetical protein RHMOL_Rhmol04G0176900 [Rhododendron molle]|uniref:Uncharacterized protein n=1 Tax=Rhododendron molle TaxID=49168 RepID=A0ACC0P2T4_RHOML|nr:hypothetical protein RHMOL_Rhmol04G0176900 [Rhododendron molle]